MSPVNIKSPIIEGIDPNPGSIPPEAFVASSEQKKTSSATTTTTEILKRSLEENKQNQGQKLTPQTFSALQKGSVENNGGIGSIGDYARTLMGKSPVFGLDITKISKN